MGLTELQQYLKHSKNSDLSAIERIPHGSHLLIDALDWLNYLLNSSSPEKTMTTKRQSYASYLEIDNLIREAHYQLIGYGFTMSLYFDGKKSLLRGISGKNPNISDNLGRSLNDGFNAAKTCDGKLGVEIQYPPLAIIQYKCTLKSLGVKITSCEYEAIQMIASDCYEMNESCITPFYCYSTNM